MHPDRTFHTPDRALHETLIERVGFGMIFAATPAGPRVAHTPLLIAGEGLVQFHLSRGNALAPHVEGGEVLIVVNGPDGYISPRWYANRDTVPTWNYAALELAGPVRRITETELAAFLHAAIARHEGALPGERWRAEECSDETWAGLLRGITGFELAVREWRPTFKMSQNKSAEDRARIRAGLKAAGAARLADTMDMIAR